MTDQTAAGNGASDKATASEPPLLITSHYIKDLSFENPHAPEVFSELQKGPAIDVSLNVERRQLKDRLFEVALTVKVTATLESKTLFLVELVLGGLATLGETIEGEAADRLLLTEVPRYLFPFARAMIGEATRDGGFPPLLLNPVNFDEFYRSRKGADAQPAPAAT